MKFPADRFCRTAAFFAVCALPLLVTGCSSIANIGNSAGPVNMNGAERIMGGAAHGGYNYIGGATVTLYAAGSAGYGTAYNSSTAPAGAKAIAFTTTSTVDGSFSFVQSGTTQSNNDTSSTYSCPSSTTQMYLVVRGGNTSGSGGTAGNTASALMTAIGPCSSDNQSYITVNEATTVAMAFAMQQFMSVTTSDIFVGTPNTTNGTNGLNNAYTTFLSLVNPTYGAFNTSLTPSSTAAGVTITATPETAKMTTMANILANCVNQTTSTQTPCSNLMSDVVKPTYKTTPQSVSGMVAPTDTAMAAYYLAINPTQSQDGTARNTTIYNLSTGYTPYGTGLGAAPTDWTVAIVYSNNATTCTNAASGKPFGYGAVAGIAIDATGDVWVTNGASSKNVVAEVSPSGGLINCIGGAFGYGNAILIDINGNVWYTSENPAAIYEYTAGGTSITWTPVSGDEPYGLTTDTSGDIIYVPYGTSAVTAEIYANAASATSAAAPAVAAAATEPAGASTLALSYYPTTGTTKYLFAGVNTGIFPYTPDTSTDGDTFTAGTQITANNTYSLIATDGNGLIFGASEGGTASPDATWFNMAPNATSITNVSGQFAGGLNTPGGIAVDGSNNYWAGLKYAVSTGIFGFAEVDSSFDSLSPGASSGFSASSCAYNACLTGGGFQVSGLSAGIYGTAVDPSGNVWGAASIKPVSTTYGALVELVGAATPVITPLVNAVQ